jgi:magnesium chelatase subunit I
MLKSQQTAPRTVSAEHGVGREAFDTLPQRARSAMPLPAKSSRAKRHYPFSAIVGQDEMRLALLAVAVDPSIGGVLVLGDRGTGKSTAVRALAAVLPDIEAVVDCAYACDPAGPVYCEACEAALSRGTRRTHMVPVPMVDLPLGATEDRIVGGLDLERALAEGIKAFQPGLLARANRGFLYVDEVNLLDDHLVDLLIDAAASGVNVFERDGLSVRHPARFVLVGSGNPEEGELRPQLLDRFGLAVEVRTPDEVAQRVEIVKRRDAFDREPDAFRERFAEDDRRTSLWVASGRSRLSAIRVSDQMLEAASKLCAALGTDGIRGELTLVRTARALAAMADAPAVGPSHLRQAAPLALRHRLRRNPLDETGSSARIARAIDEQLPP